MLTKRHIQAVKLTLPNTPESASPTSGALERASMSPAGTEIGETSKDEGDRNGKLDGRRDAVCFPGLVESCSSTETEGG